MPVAVILGNFDLQKMSYKQKNPLDRRNLCELDHDYATLNMILRDITTKVLSLCFAIMNLWCTITELQPSTGQILVKWVIFYPFIPRRGAKNQNFQKMKISFRDIIILHQYTKNHHHVYSYWVLHFNGRKDGQKDGRTDRKSDKEFYCPK